MPLFKNAFHVFQRIGYLARASAWAVVLGILEVLGSSRGRGILAIVTIVGGGAAVFFSHPFRIVTPGQVVFRTNRLTGRQTELHEGLAFRLPGLHDFHSYSLRDQVYRPARSARADGDAPFQTIEGLSIGVDVTVRYALDPARLGEIARRLPDDVGTELVEPVTDGILHRTLAKHTVREIFTTQRVEIQQAISDELHATLSPDGVIVKAVFLGSVDLPEKYKDGLEAMLAEELSSEKMRFTLELREKQVKQTELEAQADKIKRETAAEAAGQETIIAAKAQEEAMKHVLPFKEKEIEQKRLEAEAAKVTRLKQAEGEAESRRIESGGEADARRKLADADAYRIEVTGKANSEQLARESILIAKNPLLIQKTLADKLSDKIQVIVAPPQAGGFFAGGLLGTQRAQPADKSDKPGDKSSRRSDDDSEDPNVDHTY